MVRFFVTFETRSHARNAVSMWWAVIFIVVVAATLPSSSALAQEEFFKPVFRATPTPKPREAAPVFSFGRLEPGFKTLCRGLEEDGRRERVVLIAEAGVAREKVCITCRSFWKMIVGACGKLGPRPTPKPKKTKAPKGAQGTDAVPAAQGKETGDTPQDSAEGAQKNESQDVVPAPTADVVSGPLNGKHQPRYPSTALLDETSRMSTEIYLVDNGEGQVAEMFRYFAKTVRETSDLSGAEREYYDIFLTYLLSAWAGRVDSTKLPPPTPPVELDAFFE